MKRWLLVVVAVVGCKKPAPSASAVDPDCELIKKAPASAVAELSKKYPNDAPKVALTIENCIAPVGDECDRVAAIVKAIPTMSGLKLPAGNDDFAATCRQSPPELRKCYLPSYALAHDVECAKLREKLAAATVVPTTPPKCDGGSVDVFVTGEGMWVVTGKDPASRCFAARKAKQVDREWLEKELSQFKTKDCKPAVSIAAEDDVRYQDVISVMDTAVKIGLVDVGLTTPEDLGVTFKTTEQDKAPQHCPATTIASAPASAAGPGSGGVSGRTPGADTNPMASAPVVIVTKDTISVGARGAGSGAAPGPAPAVAAVKDVKGGTGVIDELKRALPLASAGSTPLIIQADQDTPANVIARVVQSAKAAGYDNVLFAVKNK